MKPIFQRHEKIILFSVLLISIIAWAAFDFYRNYLDRKAAAARHAAAMSFQPTDCQRNLYFLDIATTKWATNTHQFTTNYPTAENLQTYLEPAARDLAIALPIQSFPSCPDGGNYTYGTLALATICSKHGNAVLPTPPQSISPTPSFIRAFLYSLGLSRRGHGTPCIAELKMLDGAGQQWALENKKKGSDLINPLEAVHYLKSSNFPVCPQGGKYYFNYVSNPPFCTITGHSLP